VTHSESLEALTAGRAALDAGAWPQARDAFERALVIEDTPEAHEGLGLAAWWLDLADVVFDSRERAYRAYRSRGDQPDAATAGVIASWAGIDFDAALAWAEGQPQSPATTGSIDTCGVFGDLNFGRERPGTRLDDSILSGWGARPYDWQFGVSVQQQILPRVSVEAGYYRRWWPIFTTADITDNINTTAADYARFSVYAPSDPRLPNGGGYAVPGIYNINAAPSLVVPNNVQKAANSFGSYTRYWDGFDVTAQARLRNGVNLQGGTSTGRLFFDQCEPRDTVPESALLNPYCRQVEPWLTTFKGVASYIIPRVDVNVAGTFSSRPGVALSANVTYTNADMLNPARSTLGRSLNAASTITVSVIEPNSMLGDRIDQLDIRVGKILRWGKTRTNLNLDIVNALNSNDNLGYSGTFGATWPAPTSVLTARLFRLSAQLDF